MFTSLFILEQINECLDGEDCVYQLEDEDYGKFAQEHQMPPITHNVSP